ncbi:MAG: hypothetical protein HY821_18105 [Acidobacteria bacterium]|nr:hypothetical protein [Acidobacteriota bacterium]
MRLARFSCCAVAGLLPWLNAQPPAPASADGVVLHSVTSEPLPQVQVGFQLITERTPGRPGPRAIGAITDSSGHFHVEALEPGDYRVIIHKENFGVPRAMTASLRMKVGSTPVTNLRFLLQPRAVLFGNVVDDFGDPIAGAFLQAFRRITSRGASSDIVSGFGGATDDLGRFRITGVEPGRYLVHAIQTYSREVLYPTQGGPLTAYVATFAPSTLDPLRADIFEARAGEETGPIAITLQRVPVFAVRGRLVDSSGGPPGPFSVSLRSAHNIAFYTQPAYSHTNPDGAFELLGVPAGDWVITAMLQQRSSGARPNISARIAVSQSDVEGVVLRAAPPVIVTGAVSLEGSKPDWRQVVVAIRPAGASVFSDASINQVRADGTFELTCSGYGSARVEVIGRPAAGTYVASITAGSADLTARSFPLEQGLGAPLRITFRSGAASIQGRTDSRRPASVLLWPADPDAREPQPLARAETDAAGAFSFSDLAPGSYFLYAVAPEDPIAFGRAELPAPADLDQRGTRVKLESGASNNVVIPILEGS